jgi:hypothetical protein
MRWRIPCPTVAHDATYTLEIPMAENQKPKLCQIVAVEKGLKSRAYDDLKKRHHELQKGSMLDGFVRSYRPYNDTDTEKLPPENKVVQLKAADVIAYTTKTLAEAFDVVATKEWGNTTAKASVVVDGTVLVQDAPVAYLLYLEHQVEDLSTFIDKLPTLDPAEEWVRDDNKGFYVTQPVDEVRTRKQPRTIVKYEATKDHPAQTELFTEDVAVGRYTRVKFSGALPVARVNELRERIQKLRDAVKFAREQANTIEVEPKKLGKQVLDFLFA